MNINDKGHRNPAGDYESIPLFEKERDFKGDKTVKFETCTMSRPYPFFKLCRDGRAVVLSIGSRYFRLSF